MKKRTTRTPKTKPTKVKKVVRLSKKGGKGKSAKAIKKAKSTPLPPSFENFLKRAEGVNKTYKQIFRKKAEKLFEQREFLDVLDKKDIARQLSRLKTTIYYNPEFRFRSYHPFGDKKRRKIWIDNFTGKKGPWRTWNGEYYLTKTGRIKKWTNPLTGVYEQKKKYTPVMEKEYLKVAREMHIRLLQQNKGLNRQEAVVEYTKLAAKGRSYVFEQIGSRR